MYISSERQEWELFRRELEKIDIEDVCSYLAAHKWQRQKSQYDPRLQVFTHQGNILLLPVDIHLSDFHARLASALRTIALTEGIWTPYLIISFIKGVNHEC